MNEESKNIRQPEKRIENSDLNDPELVSSLSASTDDIIFRIVRASSIPATISSLSDSRYLEVSDSFIRLSGYGRDEIIGHPLSEYTSGLNPGENDPAISILQKRKSTSKSKIKLKTKTAKGRICSITSNLIEINGQRCLLNFYEDMFKNQPDILELSQSDRKRLHLTEQALLESEERYRAVWENSPVGICMTDKDGIYHYVNPAYCRMYEYSEDELIGRCYVDLILPKENRENPLQNYSRTFKPGKLVSLDRTQFIKKNGERIWVQYTGDFVWLNGKPQFLVSMNVDVTELMKVEEKIRESQERIHALMNSTTESMLLVDKKGKFLAVNEIAAKKFNLSVDDLIGSDYTKISPEILPLEVVKYRLSLLNKVIKTGKPIRFQDERNGIVFDTNYYPVFDPQGKAIQVAIFATDITERKKAEDALHDSEETFRVISGSALDAIIMIADNDRITFWNKAAEDIFGYSENEVVGKRVHTLLAPKRYSQAIKQGFANFRKTGTGNAVGKTIELSALKKDGIEFPIEISISSIIIKGKRHAVGIIRNITERKEATEALKESEEKYRLLVENAGEPIFTVNFDGVFLTMNNAAVEYLGGKPSDFIGKTMWDLFPRQVAEMQMDNIRNAIKSGKKISTTTKTILHNEEKWFITNIQPINSPNGKITSALLIASDITEIKQHEIRGNARSQLIDNLRSAKEINECLKLGCQAIEEANMFKRAAMTLHNKAKEIIHAGYIGLEEDLVKIALKAPAPDDKLSRKMTREKYRINYSYFIPVEDGLFKEDLGRYIPQQDDEKGSSLNWKNGDEFFAAIIGANNKPEGWLSVDTPFNGKRPALEDAVYLEEIIDITGKKIREIKNLELLRNERQTLHEKNITLREVLSHIEKEKMEIKRQVIDEIDSTMMPALKKLVNNDGTVNKIYYNILNNCLRSLASSTGGIQRLFSKLSPREVEICSLIKNGASSKEIAMELNISLATVQKHREIIRKKLGMTNKNINLASFLKNQ